MEEQNGNPTSKFFEGFGFFLRRCIFSVLSIGPVPNHIAFIMDGNQRYAKKRNLEEGAGHKVGFLALINMLKYCYELDVKYVTVYAFSIENFKRRPEEVQSTMQLIQEKIEELIEEGSVEYGVRVYFVGNLELLSNSVKLAAQRAMEVTSDNSNVVLTICIAYTSTDGIVHAVKETCKEKWEEFGVLDTIGAGYASIGLAGDREYECLIDLKDIEKHVRMAIALWPEIGFRHLVQAILDFQRNFIYPDKKKEYN